MTLEISPVATLRGELRPPSDKSLTHRAYMFAAMARGESEVVAPLRGEDCEATLRCMSQLGMRYEWTAPDRIRLLPAAQWTQPRDGLDCGNSGTTIRLLSGLVASHDLTCTLFGDASLNRRPMRRIAEPLRLMGAGVDGDTPPLNISGGRLRAIDYRSPVASAQVKSCILLAALRAEGVTTVIEPNPSRDHTERMLRATGVEVMVGDGISVRGGQQPNGFSFRVPADISSSAFMMVATAILPSAELIINDLSVNPTRTGILDVLDQCEISYRTYDERDELGEPVAEMILRRSGVPKPFDISGALVPRLIDEIPVLAVLATQCDGTTTIRDASEMRVKESDRIETMATGLRAMGAQVETFPDGMAISGPTKLNAARIDAGADHRIAMAFAVAGLVADGTTLIDGAETIATSYPDFMDDLMRLCIV